MTILKFVKTSYKLPDNLLVTSNLSEVFDEIKKFNGQAAVSNTHLTLPTKA